LFIKACIKPVDPTKKAKLIVGGKDDNKDDNSMDFREFVTLIEKLGLCPDPFNKTILAKVGCPSSGLSVFIQSSDAPLHS
jgi:hypothetical protein